MTAFFARRLREIVAGTVLDGFIPLDAILVPIPRSTPLRKDAYWPAEMLGEALVDQGFGRAILDLLERVSPLTAASRSERRPTFADHLSSIGARRDLLSTGRPLVLVDDVVSAGTTAMACATLLLRENDDLDSLRVFAAARTREDPLEIPSVREPIVGQILNRGGYCRRSD